MYNIKRYCTAVLEEARFSGFLKRLLLNIGGI